MRQSLKIACGAAFLAMVTTAPASAQRSAGADTWFECWPAEVSVFANRTHIGCYNSLGRPGDVTSLLLGFGNPKFFAVLASDVRLTSAAVTLGQAAITSNRRIWIAFDYFDLTGDAYGCRFA